MKQKAVSSVTGELLLEQVDFLVVVDEKSRRPVQIPQQMMDITENFHPARVPVEKILPLEKPNQTHIVKYVPKWSNTDYYFHTNQAQYLKYVHDAAADLVKEGKLKVFTDDIAKYRIKEMITQYQGETRPNEELDIHVW